MKLGNDENLGLDELDIHDRVSELKRKYAGICEQQEEFQKEYDKLYKKAQEAKWERIFLPIVFLLCLIGIACAYVSAVGTVSLNTFMHSVFRAFFFIVICTGSAFYCIAEVIRNRPYSRKKEYELALLQLSVNLEHCDRRIREIEPEIGRLEIKEKELSDVQKQIAAWEQYVGKEALWDEQMDARGENGKNAAGGFLLRERDDSDLKAVDEQLDEAHKELSEHKRNVCYLERKKDELCIEFQLVIKQMIQLAIMLVVLLFLEWYMYSMGWNAVKSIVSLAKLVPVIVLVIGFITKYSKIIFRYMMEQNPKNYKGYMEKNELKTYGQEILEIKEKIQMKEESINRLVKERVSIIKL